MPFNSPLDHHLPGLCDSVRGSTLGARTGLRHKIKESRVARGCFWSVKLRPVRLRRSIVARATVTSIGGEVLVPSPDRNEVRGRLAVWSNSVRTVG